MRQAQLEAATQIAQSKEPLDKFATTIFDGFGLPNFNPIVVTLRELAWLIRWQCVRLNGTLDSNELSNIQAIGRRKFTIV